MRVLTGTVLMATLFALVSAKVGPMHQEDEAGFDYSFRFYLAKKCKEACYDKKDYPDCDSACRFTVNIGDRRQRGVREIFQHHDESDPLLAKVVRNAMGETLDNRRRTGISDSKAAIDFVKRMNYWDRKVHDQEAHDEL